MAPTGEGAMAAAPTAAAAAGAVVAARVMVAARIMVVARIMVEAKMADHTTAEENVMLQIQKHPACMCRPFDAGKRFFHTTSQSTRRSFCEFIDFSLLCVIPPGRVPSYKISGRKQFVHP